MRVFKPESFDLNGSGTITKSLAADIANGILERQGSTIYGNIPSGIWTVNKRFGGDTHKALLINIEPLEKCKHLKEDVKEDSYNMLPPGGIMCSVQVNTGIFRCKCGIQVTPAVFEEIK